MMIVIPQSMRHFFSCAGRAVWLPAVLLCLWGVCLMSVQSAETAAMLYVSPHGNDRWSGRLAQPDGGDGPFATPARAVRAIREALTAGRTRVTVQVRGGEYRLREPLILDAACAPPPGGAVTIEAFPGETPVLTGDLPLMGWKPLAGELPGLPDAARGKVWVAEAPQGRAIPALYLNGARMQPAMTEPSDDWERWPAATPGATRGELMLPKALQRPWASPAQMCMNFLPTKYTYWKNVVTPVRGIEGAVVRFDERALPTILDLPPRVPLRFENVVECLSAPGRWYHDAAAGRVYLWPPKGVEMARTAATVPTLGMAVGLRGDEGAGRFVHGVTLRGLAFRQFGEGAAVRLEAVEDCAVEGCAFDDLEGNGIEILRYAQRVRVQGNSLTNLGGTAIACRGHGFGLHQVNRGHLIADNTIADGGRRDWHASGISVNGAGYLTISHNRIERMPYSCIQVGASKIREYQYARAHPDSPRAAAYRLGEIGDDPLTVESVKRFTPGHVLIEANDCRDFMRQLDDGGAIYSHASHHNIIRGNRVVQAGRPNAFGIYLDDEELDTLIEGNLVAGCPPAGQSGNGAALHIHDNARNTIRNNVFALSYRLFSFPNSYGGLHITRNILLFKGGVKGEREPKVVTGPGDGRRQADWTAGPSAMDANLYWSVDDEAGLRKFFAGWQGRGWDAHGLVANPGFANPAALDFRLPPDSPAVKIGFIATDWSRVGPRPRDAWKASVEMPERPLYSRADLPRLQTLDRQEVFATLGSFDERGMTEEEFAWRALELLDPARVPGLAEARMVGDLPGALAAVLVACRQEPPAEQPELTEDARKLADDALAHRFTFYGETHRLPAELDWDVNPGTAHWGHDLNRFTYLALLTQAYRATGDARYARKAVALMLDWVAKNDFARSFRMEKYAFGSYLNLAIHAGAWARALDVLVDGGQVEPLELLRILKSLQDHLAYLEIVTNGHGGNWPTIGCMGMLSVLERFPVPRDTGRFATYCRDTLAVQIADQVLPDGVQDELTPHYHQVVVNNLANACRSLRALGMDLAPETLATLRQMVRYSQQTITPDGSKHVAFNDSDPGSVPNLARQMAALGLEDFLRPAEELGPETYPYAGVAFLRQRPDQGDLYLAFDAGPFGRSHQHEDKLGFWLFAYGRNFLVDPGRHLYDRSAVSYYEYLCSTRAHSTILVDGQGQNSRARRDTWIAKAPLDLGWQAREREIRTQGVYDLGFGPKNAIPVTHRREIVFVRERCWVIFDVLEGEGEHDIESRFQFAPGNVMLEGTRARTDFPDANLLLWPLATQPIADAHLEKGQENPRGGWYSDGYNKIEPAPALSLRLRGPLPVRLATLLFPYRGTEKPVVEFAFDGETATIRTAEMGEVRVAAHGGT